MSLPDAGLTITPTVRGGFDGAMLLAAIFMGLCNY